MFILDNRSIDLIKMATQEENMLMGTLAVINIESGKKQEMRSREKQTHMETSGRWTEADRLSAKFLA